MPTARRFPPPWSVEEHRTNPAVRPQRSSNRICQRPAELETDNQLDLGLTPYGVSLRLFDSARQRRVFDDLQACAFQWSAFHSTQKSGRRYNCDNARG